MTDAIQVVLVDPIEESRQSIQKLFGGITTVWLAEVCTSYQGAARRIAEIAPNLVLINIDEDPAQAVSLVATIAQNMPSVAVLPASRVRDSSIILRVIRAGAREFLTLPTSADELLESINHLFNRRDDNPASAAKGPQTISVTGAAGGIGCTTLAVNIATSLAKASTQEVILADFDLMLGSLDACLDIIPDHTVQGVIQNLDRLDVTLLKRSMTRHSTGLYVLPHPVAIEEAAKIDPESLRRVLEMLKTAFPTIVIDTSKGLQASDFVAFELSDLILIVVQLDLTCLRNTSRLLQLFQQFEGLNDRVRLVVNRSGSHENEISIKKAEETLKMPISWHIPNATKIVHAARAKGVPIDAHAPGSRLHLALADIAKAIRPSAAEAPKARKSIFAALF